MQNNRKKMKILITGGAGYVGSHLTKYLLKKNYKIDIIDDLSNSKLAVIQYLKKNKNFGIFYKINIGNKKKLPNILKKNKYDVLIHLAAKIDARESLKKKLYYKLNNFDYSKYLFNLSRKEKIKKIIFASSAAVYGNLSQKNVSENLNCKPINPYGVYKLKSELYLKSSKDFNYIIFRLFNICGIQKETMQFFKKKNSVFFKIRNSLKERMTFYLNTTNNKTGDNSFERDFIYIKDFCRIIEKMLISKKVNYTVNIGSGINISIKKVIRKFETLFKNKMNIIEKKFQGGEPLSVIANNNKLKTILKFNKFTGINKIIKEYQY